MHKAKRRVSSLPSLKKLEKEAQIKELLAETALAKTRKGRGRSAVKGTTRTKASGYEKAMVAGWTPFASRSVSD